MRCIDKKDNRIKRILSTFLCIVIMIESVLLGVPSYATNSSDSITDCLGHEAEKTVEAQEDSCENYSAGDWKSAIYKDGLAWNYFHNEVQSDVVTRYNSEGVSKEQEIKGLLINNVKTTKKGRADILKRESSEVIYIWEVKPKSFMNSDKRAKAIEQLNSYVGAEPYYFRGSNQITGNSITRYVDKENYEATYQITYTVESDGLIFYSFERTERKKNDNENQQAQTSSNSVRLKSTASSSKMVSEASNNYSDNSSSVRNEKTNENNNSISNNKKISWKTIVTMAAFADTLSVTLSKINTSVTRDTAVQAGNYSEKVVEFVVKNKSKIVRDAAAGVPIVASELSNLDVAAADLDYSELEDDYLDFMDYLKIVYGDEYYDKLQEALDEEDYEEAEEIIKDIQKESEEYEKASKTQPPKDPLIIDLGEEGIELCTVKDGVNFDLDNNGFAEKTAWIGNEDGFLAYDRNNNGKIDNGGELFGDQVILKSGVKSLSGFDALLELDNNQDEKIDEHDSIYDILIVWKDTNHNGISETNEMTSLSDNGIESISLNHSEVSVIDDETGTRIAEQSVVIITGGTDDETTISEFWFPVNATDTMHGGKITSGNIKSLSNAIEEDETGELFRLVMAYGSSNTIADKRYYTKRVLYFLSNANDIEPNSRGGNIDARDLKVIEEFMGATYEGIDGGFPNVNAANILCEIYNRIEDDYYSYLNVETALFPYIKMIELMEIEDSESIDTAMLLSYINSSVDCGDDVDLLIYDIALFLKIYDKTHDTGYFSTYCSYYADKGYENIISLAENGTSFLGDENNNSYGTSNNDFIFAEAGNDVISGFDGIDYCLGGIGDDTLDGGSGNDYLSGEEGDDYYIFKKGYGIDTIKDSSGSNTIKFEGINSKNIRVNGLADYSVVISVVGTDDKLILKDFKYGDCFSNYILIFDDRTVHSRSEDSPLKLILGNDDNDMLRAVINDSFLYGFDEDDDIIGSDGMDIIYGNGGNDYVLCNDSNDTVFGGEGNDEIYGNDGDDIIYGNNGDDIIYPGKGNDYIFGGTGEDYYYYETGDGIDVIVDNDGVSDVFLSNIEKENIKTIKAGDDLIISLNENNDILVVTEFFINTINFRISDSNGPVTIDDIVTQADYYNSIEFDNAEQILNSTPTDADYATIASIGDAVGNSNTFEGIRFSSGTQDSNAIFAKNGFNFIGSGAGYDYIVGSDNRDYIFGDGDLDRILAGEDNDVIFGLSDGDQLFGEYGDDIISGGSGGDYINSGTGDDIIMPGEGDNIIEDEAGNDVYIIANSGNNDYIIDNNGENVIVFDEGIMSKNVIAQRSNWNDLRISFDNSDNSVTIKNYCIDENARNFELIFSDGVIESATVSDGVLRDIKDEEYTEYNQSIYEDGCTITAKNGDDQINGSDGDDLLIGGDGSNRITGNGGDDTLDGGKGSDSLYGGPGDDIYVYSKSYGADMISDSEGYNEIQLLDYSISDIKSYRTNWNNLTIIFADSSEEGLYDDSVDKIIIENFFVSDANRNYTLACRDAIISITDEQSPCRILYGTSGRDYLLGFDEGRITIYGCSGEDTINGNTANDILFGNEGNDRLLSYGGSDELYGGLGDDYIEGGTGDDIYHYSLGDGIDSISDNQGVNTLVFDNINYSENVKFYRTNWNDLTIEIESEADKIVLLGYFTSQDNRVFNLQFANDVYFEYDSEDNPCIMLLDE